MVLMDGFAGGAFAVVTMVVGILIAVIVKMREDVARLKDADEKLEQRRIAEWQTSKEVDKQLSDRDSAIESELKALKGMWEATLAAKRERAEVRADGDD
jgi:predicted Holliday junction resolvase-like endonuclease